MAKIAKQLSASGDRIRTGLVRFSFPYLFEPRPNEDGTSKYELCILIPNDDKDTLKLIDKAIEAATARGVAEKWGGKKPKKLQLPLRDGDEKEDMEGFENCMFLNTKTKLKPNIIDKTGTTIIDPEEIYAGCYGSVALSFYPYNTSGNNGVGVCLDNVIKLKDGERLGGGKPSAESDFGDIDTSEYEDDDL